MVHQARDLCALFADVSGTARLHDKLGDKEALHAVERCINRMSRVTDVHHGRIVKTVDDHIMSVFRSAEDGMQAACEMQQRIAALPPVSGVKLSVRIGFHHGPAVEDEYDVFGDTVDIAARMVELARGGQIITTPATADALPPRLRAATRGMDAPAAHDKSGRIRVCEVLWQEGGRRAAQWPGTAESAAEPCLRLRHGERSLLLDGSRSQVTMGRGTANDIYVTDRRASRQHARLERRRDQFVIVDQSTNGTYVLVEGEAEFVLKREEAVLRGRGRISFGHVNHVEGDVVEFEILS